MRGARIDLLCCIFPPGNDAGQVSATDFPV